MPECLRHRLCAVALALLSFVLVPIVMERLTPIDEARADSRPIASLADIRRLAAEAYVWGLGPQFTWRFAKYNTTINAPINALTYGENPAAWNNSATNAGNSSLIYINGFMDFSSGTELVLTVPPSRNQYYVVNYLDDYINTIGSIGMRTTPSDVSQSYLLVGPNSRFANKKVATIGGHTLPVMASDTNLNWMLIRILTSTLADSTALNSTPSIYDNVSKKFALNTLAQFRANGFQPVFPTDYTNPPPTDAEIAQAKPYKDTPSEAVRFFDQLGQSLVKSPIARLTTALGGTPLRRLPAYVVPQYGAKTIYLPPSFGQAKTLRHFARIGLTANGYKVPAGWGLEQFTALQQGYEDGQVALNKVIASQTLSAGPDTNYWTILNDLIGTYPNSLVGYLVRSTIVLNGGSANIPLDAVYPTMTSNSSGLLDGNQTYSITFTEAQLGAQLPVIGIYPPQVTDTEGKIKGLWSLTVYQPDASEVSAPFLPQSAVLNNAYSTVDSEVLAISSTNDTITVTAPNWGKLIASTPILFDGSAAAGCGLNTKMQNGVYYVAGDPVQGTGPGDVTTYTFPMSTQWKQDISDDDVPIQYSGAASDTVNLTCDSGSNLSWGMLKPVSQLGSSELEDGKLVKNGNGSLTIWLAPTLPDGVPATNWIPTPSSDYYNGIYGSSPAISTTLQVILRSYYPTPGNQPPSILPYTAGNLPESYIPPAIVTAP
jgi:hypothetical protein